MVHAAEDHADEDHAANAGTDARTVEDDYVEQVRREIAEEVQRRAATDLPPRLERELDEMFMRHSPLGSGGTGLTDILRHVDAAVFIDPMVPVESRRPGGVAVKRGLRSLTFWYQRFVTHQVSTFAAAVGRALHVVDAQLTGVRARLDALAPPPSVVIEASWAHRLDAWWVGTVLEELAGTARAATSGGAGRVLHAACGDGWLVRALLERGVDAYGVDPRPRALTDEEADALDLREEGVADHLEAVDPGSLAAVVLSGVVEGAPLGDRHRLLVRAARAVGPGGVLVVHSLSRAAWEADDAPLQADLVPARPYRPATWGTVLGEEGLTVTVDEAADGRDYLVRARRRPTPGA
ncbi:MAG TPA: methyltransferase domain-containing protein [Acidimicrobiales bacterium]|nr:methyltransferase domain-containing protein [Acidimicrobiales bacterium]